MGRISKNGQQESTISSPSTTNEKPHLKKLAEHKHIYDFYVQTGEVVGLHPHVKDEIVSAYRVEFPFYHYNMACPSCTIEMLETIYKWYGKQ